MRKYYEMTGWTPLFEQIIASSIWSAPDHIRIAWITMLALCRRDGVCPVTNGGLARLANITGEQAADALRVLSSPDSDSLTPDGGVRIVRVENGWKLVNWQKYREMAKSQLLKEQNREAQARWRSKQSELQENPSEKYEDKVAPETYTSTSRVVLQFLNEKTGRRFRECDESLGPINARMKESGVDLVGVKQMIERQCLRWKGTRFEEFLRPSTLFAPTKFNEYYAAREMPVQLEDVAKPKEKTLQDKIHEEMRRKIEAL